MYCTGNKTNVRIDITGDPPTLLEINFYIISPVTSNSFSHSIFQLEARLHSGLNDGTRHGASYRSCNHVITLLSRFRRDFLSGISARFGGGTILTLLYGEYRAVKTLILSARLETVPRIQRAFYSPPRRLKIDLMNGAFLTRPSWFEDFQLEFFYRFKML